MKPEAWLIREIRIGRARILPGEMFKSEATALAAAKRLTYTWRTCVPVPVVPLASVEQGHSWRTLRHVARQHVNNGSGFHAIRDDDWQQFADALRAYIGRDIEP